MLQRRPRQRARKRIIPVRYVGSQRETARQVFIIGETLVGEFVEDVTAKKIQLKGTSQGKSVFGASRNKRTPITTITLRDLHNKRRVLGKVWLSKHPSIEKIVKELLKTPPFTYWWRAVNVTKGFREQGIGKQLYESMLSLAKERGIRLLIGKPQKLTPAFIRIFQRFGFKKFKGYWYKIVD